MKTLIKKILREQEEVKGATGSNYDYDTKKHYSVTNTVSTTQFFMAVRYLVENNSYDILDSLTDDDSWSRWQALNKFLKLIGITENDLDQESAAGIPSKMLWAAIDNYEGIKSENIKSFDQLELRPLKQYKATCYENTTEHVTYYWEPTLEGYSERDVQNEIIEDEDGSYAWWEWEGTPEFDREVGDSDSDGIEIEDIIEVGIDKKQIKEVESPEENDLIDKLRKIMKQWKKEDKENEWYDKIENALKELHVPL